MKTFKIRVIAYVTFGIFNLVGFIYLVGETRYHISTATSQYEAAPFFPQDLSSWFSGRQ
jgi:hypothetical protein